MADPQSQQVETAAQIVLHINGDPHRVAEVTYTDEVNVEMIYGNQLEPAGWAVSEVSYSGSLSFNGDVAGEINPKLTQNDGVTPTEGNSLTITHMDGSSKEYQDVFITQTEYNSSENEVTTTDYEWVAMSSETSG